MKTLLFINGCIRGKNSKTYKLAKAYISKLEELYNVNIIERILTKEEINPLKEENFSIENGIPLPKENYSLAEEFARADEIIIAVPFWEFTFPAVLSCYIENISVPKITFAYNEKGSYGLCQAKQMTYIYTSGNILVEEERIGEKLLNRLSKLYGIDNFDSIGVEGMDISEENAPYLLNEGIEKAIKKAISHKIY